MQWWSPLMKWLYAFGVVVASFFITLWAMNYVAPLCPQGQVVALTGPFEQAGAVSWWVKVPSLAPVFPLAYRFHVLGQRQFEPEQERAELHGGSSALASWIFVPNDRGCVPNDP
jgi:hypothetical protein